jgi:ankyrin repeat protein
MEAVKYGHLDYVKFLIKKGALIHYDCNRKSILMNAVESGRLESVEYVYVKLLRRNQTSITEEDNEGNSALSLAKKRRFIYITAYLMNELPRNP